MAEPVTLDQAKAHLRIIDDTDEDALITALIVAAREWVENFTGHILVEREVTDTFSCFGWYLELTRRPVSGTPVVSYLDTDGAEQEVATVITSGAKYPFRIYPASGSSWPSFETNTTITVTYTAGYPEGDVPQSLVQAMFLLIGAWWAHREAIVIGASVSEAPFAVLALCQPYRSPLL
jgi:uncharacterized phiE125 gp8 family phage protein